MGDLVIFKVPVRLDRRALEKNLLAIERAMPFLRKHIREVTESPTKLHIDQVRASLDGIRSSLDYLSYYLKDLNNG